MDTPSTASLTLSQLISETSRRIDHLGYLVQHPQLYVSERFYLIRNQIDIRVEELLITKQFAENKESKLNGRRDELLKTLAAEEKDCLKYVEANSKTFRAQYEQRLKQLMTEFTTLTGPSPNSRAVSPAVINGRKSRSASPRDAQVSRSFSDAFNGDAGALRKQLLKLHDSVDHDIYEFKREICLDKSLVLNSVESNWNQSPYYFGKLILLSVFMDENELSFIRKFEFNNFKAKSNCLSELLKLVDQIKASQSNSDETIEFTGNKPVTVSVTNEDGHKEAFRILDRPALLIEILTRWLSSKGGQLITLNEEDLVTYLNNSKRLKLTNLQLSMIDQHAFSEVFLRLENLTMINLGNNNLSYIKPNTFKNLKHVQVLVVDNNQIESIDSNEVFKGLSSLVDLSLNRNRAELTLSDYAFEHLPNLQTLRLDSSNITALTASNLFYNLTNLTRLNVSKNSLEAVNEYTFKYLANLEVLLLNANKISRLCSNAFDGLFKLKRLNLSANKLESMSDTNLFNYMTNLEELDLSSNRIGPIDANIFKRLTSLKKLDMSGNRLNSLDENLFRNQAGLTTLNLSSNQIKRVDSKCFKANSKLQTLNLGKNKICSLEGDQFETLVELTELHLNHNQFKQIHISLFARLENLRFLDLSFNHLYYVEDHMFDKCTNLQRLNLNKNNIRAFNLSCVKGLTHLKQLNISENDIESLDETLLSFLLNLEFLNF